MGHAPGASVWYNRSMTASRIRRGALLALLLLFVGAIAIVPGGRALVRRAAVHFHLISPDPPLGPGRPLTGLSLENLDGADVAFPGAPGRALVINVFTSWCPSCNVEMPALSKAAPALAREGIDVVGVDQAESGWKVRQFLQTYGISYPVYIDAANDSRYSLGARVIPTTLFVDKRHVVRVVHVGPLDVASFLAMARSSE